MEPHPDYNEERLDALDHIRQRFLGHAEDGDETAASILRAVEGMIAEVEEWILR